jgi:hypothetical protein
MFSHSLPPLDLLAWTGDISFHNLQWLEQYSWWTLSIWRDNAVLNQYKQSSNGLDSGSVSHFLVIILHRACRTILW